MAHNISEEPKEGLFNYSSFPFHIGFIWAQIALYWRLGWKLSVPEKGGAGLGSLQSGTALVSNWLLIKHR